MIGDADLKVSKLYDMLPAAADPSGPRTAADNQTVRTVYVIGPDKKIKLMMAYPDVDGPQLRRDPARRRFHPAHRQAQGGDARPTGRRART